MLSGSGSPPRMRGKECRQYMAHLSPRITPAYAGKSHLLRFHPRLRQDHPRVCGEKIHRVDGAESTSGSPPRMRGKAQGTDIFELAQGITPAYAGKRLRIFARYECRGDHPRVCGEKEIAAGRDVAYWGSPPRMRGKVDEFISHGRDSGITPAYAGKSPLPLCRHGSPWDHPRVCGEKCLAGVMSTLMVGSPPRMRGKVAPYASGQHPVRITPAYAGKSGIGDAMDDTAEDHPRVCGEKYRQKVQE